MRIYIKEKDKRPISLRLPLGIATGIGRIACKFAVNKYVTNENAKAIDYDLLFKALKEFKHYKGMDIVDISDKDGTVVKITV